MSTLSSTVIDQRPSYELSQEEVAMYLVQGIRARSIRNLPALEDYAKKIFPDMTDEQRDGHLRYLANRLTLNDSSLRHRRSPRSS